MQLIKKRYEALDGLRGIAALMVIFYHYSLPFFDPIGVFSDNFFVKTSYAFVDLFFVLSGFVIAANYLQRVATLKDFKRYLIKRFARLYPLLLFTVLIYMVLKGYALYAGFSFDTPNYGWSDYFIDVIEPLSFLNSTPLISIQAGMNPPSWSISAEMIAYLLFGLVIFLFQGKRFPFFLLITASIVFMLLKGRFMFASDFGFVRGTLGFSLGVLAYDLVSRNIAFRSTLHEWLFLLLLPVIFYLINRSDTELANLLLCPLYFYGIVVFSKEQGTLSKLLKARILQYLGKISYSVYLMHFIVLWCFYQLVWNVLAVTPSQFMSYFGIVLVLLIVVITSHFTYLWIELPGMKFLRKGLNADG